MSIRMAIGQLIDYRRFVDPTVRCAVLVPCLPREDLLKLLGYAGVSVYYPTKAAFTLVSLPHHAFLVAEARERVHDVVVPDPEIGLEPDRDMSSSSLLAACARCGKSPPLRQMCSSSLVAAHFRGA
jgi:hypothetical protein